MAHNAEAEFPTSSDERVEDFAQFLDTLEDDQDTATGEQPAAEDAPDPSDADTPDRADEPDEPAIVPPVSWGQDAAELFEPAASPFRRRAGSRCGWQDPRAAATARSPSAALRR